MFTSHVVAVAVMVMFYGRHGIGSRGSNKQLLQGTQKGGTTYRSDEISALRCLNVSRDGEEVMSECKSFHIPVHAPATG